MEKLFNLISNVLGLFEQKQVAVLLQLVGTIYV